MFSSFIGKTVDNILAEYDASDGRAFKRLYAQRIRAWIGQLVKEGLTSTSIKIMRRVTEHLIVEHAKGIEAIQ